METLTIYTSGSSRGNPGPAAIAVVVLDGAGTAVLEHTAMIGNATDVFAEYQAVVEALEVVEQKFGEATTEMAVTLVLDSELVKQQLNAEAQVTDPRTISHFVHIHNLRVAHYPHLTLTYIDRAQNKDANRLVTEALDAK